MERQKPSDVRNEKKDNHSTYHIIRDIRRDGKRSTEITDYELITLKSMAGIIGKSKLL